MRAKVFTKPTLRPTFKRRNINIIFQKLKNKIKQLINNTSFTNQLTKLTDWQRIISESSLPAFREYKLTKSPKLQIQAQPAYKNRPKEGFAHN